eukprot:CAMPEP_0195282404 /NCGR_PEP_ID=MMETSP0707-20130614/1288_1 /TAXON_ID=33640 /ORGANISM="Asterionellopsis glacialis, Strain CCMP134" /LENGTH=535 /DNA_ID=CAMNT_0040341369 /DNA_START=32 /DNA_END=1639 /DNA_ORIENTATION=+
MASSSIKSDRTQGSVSSDESSKSVLSATGLISKLPRTNSTRQAHKFRTLDEFYEEAHILPSKALLSILGHRLGYFMIFVSLGIANTGDSAEIGSMGFLMANENFRDDVVQGNDGLVASALYLGMLFGGLLAGPACDREGRRSILLSGLFLNSSFGLAMAFSENAVQLCACRFVMGLGIGAIVSCLLALTSEHTPPKKRGGYLNFVAAFWTIGSIYVALFAFLMFEKFAKSWRLYVLCNAAPSALAFILISIFVPESARFLGLHGHYNQAARVANRVARSMGFRGSQLTVAEIQSHFPPEEVPLKGKPALLTSCMDMFRAFANLYKGETRRNLLFVQSMWFTLSFGSGLSLWMTRVFAELQIADRYMMALFYAFSSIPGVVVAGFVLDRFSRTRLLTVAMTFTFACSLVFAALTATGASGWLIVASSCVFHSFLVLSWSVLSVITAEVFSTSSRSTALGLCAASGRIAAILSHPFFAALIESQQPLAVILLGSSSFAIGVLASVTSGLKSLTGAPLQDIEAGISLQNQQISGKSNG